MAGLTATSGPLRTEETRGNPTSNHGSLLQARKRSKEPVSTRELTTREKIILLASSKLHGGLFPPWTSPPKASEFDLRAGEPPFIDAAELSLSDVQIEIFDAWRRPSEALKQSNTTRGVNPVMATHNKVDLVQDITTDCSVVASLCAATARTEHGHRDVIKPNIYPYDRSLEQPEISSNGKYVLRMHFNGCSRRVVIDDRLPSSRISRMLHVVDRNNPSLLWPAIVEKAYLKVRGGYDFLGSNSGTDLWILTGWIPDQMFLQRVIALIFNADSDDIARDALWRRMLNAFNYGDVLITMGTGKLLQIEEEDLGLASEHDYAVIDMKESEGMQLFLVKNPWSEGTVWKGPLYRGNALGNNEKRIQDLCITKTQTNASTLGPKPGLDSELLPPGMFWMSLHDVFQSFDSIYLNWNPSLFSYKEDVHFDWDLTKDTSPEGSFVSHPQYEVRSSVGDTVWLLLSRHFTSRAQPLNIDGDINSALEDSEHGFISLYAFDSGGQRVFLKEDATVRGPYVDSPNTLLKLEVPANRAYTVVISEQGLPQACCTFTLSAFSLAQLSLTMAREKYTHATLHHGMWTDSTAGGNASSCSYHINPQFSLRLAAPSAVCLLLETTGDDFPVHVKLVWANGNQIHSISSRDIVGDSGEYRKGCALAEIDNVQAGIYTAVCSTFEQGQRGNFTLRVNTMSACAVERIPVAAAGRFVTTVQSALFPPGSCLISASLISPRLNRVSLSVQSRGDGASGKRSTKSPLSLALHQGRSSSKRILAISGGGGEYLDGHAGFRTPDVDIQPSVFEGTECVVVIKRPECLAISVAEYVDVEVFSDGPLEVGEWKHEVG